MNKIRVKCSVPGCKDYSTKRHRLPHPGKNPEKYVHWLKLAGRSDLLKEDPDKIYRVKRLCARHFSPDSYLPNYHKLRPTAEPNQFLPGQDNTCTTTPNPSAQIPTTANSSCTEAQKKDFIKSFCELLNSEFPAPAPSKPTENDEDALCTFPVNFSTIGDRRLVRHVNILSKNSPVNRVGLLRLAAKPQKTLYSEIVTKGIENKPVLVLTESENPSRSLENNPVERNENDTLKEVPKIKQLCIDSLSCASASLQKNTVSETISNGIGNEPVLDLTESEDHSRSLENNPAVRNENDTLKEVPKIKQLCIEPLSCVSASLQKNAVSGQNASDDFSIPTSKMSASQPLVLAHKSPTIVKETVTNGIGNEPVIVLTESEDPSRSLDSNSDVRNENDTLKEVPKIKQLYIEPLSCVSALLKKNNTVSGPNASADLSIPTTKTPASQPLAPTNTKKSHTVKVLGKDRHLTDPSVLSTLLSKVPLKKEGTVYILPVGSQLQVDKMTKTQLLNIVKQKMSIINRKKLIQEVKTKKSKPKKKLKKKSSIPRCTNCKRSHTIFNKTGILTTVEGHSVLNGKSNESLFNVSTILTNVDDKTQIEQLCQLVIESIFKLRHINQNKTMSSLTVYFANQFNDKSTRGKQSKKSNAPTCGDNGVNKDVNPPNDLQPTTVDLDQTPLPADKAINNDVVCSVVSTEFEPCEIRLKSSDSEQSPLQQFNTNPQSTDIFHANPKNIERSVINTESEQTYNKDTCHDHSYSDGKRKHFRKKPDYIVRLIDIDNYSVPKYNSKLGRLMWSVRNSDHKRVTKQVLTLKGIINRKNTQILNLRDKVKNLSLVLRQEKGVKRLRLKKKDSVEGQNSAHSGGQKDGDIDRLDNFYDGPPLKIRKSRKRRKHDVPTVEDNAAESSNSTPKKKKKSPFKLNSTDLDNKLASQSHKKKSNIKRTPKKNEFSHFDLSELILTNSHQLSPGKILNEVEGNEFETYEDLCEYFIEEYAEGSY